MNKIIVLLMMLLFASCSEARKERANIDIMIEEWKKNGYMVKEVLGDISDDTISASSTLQRGGQVTIKWIEKGKYLHKDYSSDELRDCWTLHFEKADKDSYVMIFEPIEKRTQ